MSFRRTVFLVLIAVSVLLSGEKRTFGAGLSDFPGLRADVGFLADSICSGRASGTAGAVEASWYITRRMRSLGFNPQYQTFMAESRTSGGGTVICRNILAEIKRPGASGWIVLTAYYDGLGIRDGKLYPGADSNASGVAGLLAVADSLAADRSISPKYNFLLVALDAHNCDTRGAGELLDRTLRTRNVRLVVNLDIIGSSLAPVQPYRPQYVMALGAEQYRKTLDGLAAAQGLSIYYDYYRSREFTDLFFRRMGDQKIFLSAGLPTVLLTSGITMNTNKETDTSETLDYRQLSRRIALLISWLRKF